MRQIGFTGNRRGMSPAQSVAFASLVDKQPQVFTFHHGDCVGSDEQAHRIVRAKRPQAIIHGHPPENDKHRAFCLFDKIEEPKPYPMRNRDIVNESHLLWGTPDGAEGSQKYSGTWMTVRLARKARLHLVVIGPEGALGS